MKKNLLYACSVAALCCSFTSFAGVKHSVKVDSGADVRNVKIVRDGNALKIRMTVDLDAVRVPRNSAYVLTPVLKSGSDSAVMQSIGLYSRGRFIQYQRNGMKKISGEDERLYRDSEMPSAIEYETSLNYQDWMNGSTLYLRQIEYGCRNCETASSREGIGSYAEFHYNPHFVYARPTAEVTKSRSISGQAYVDFRLLKTDVDPEYHDNVRELSKIRATIDSVRNDKDITINSIFLKGFASPEGKYSLNEKLASERTNAIKEYIESRCSIEDDVMHASYEPENWEGLKEYVENSQLQHKSEILEIIGSSVFKDLDAKEWRLKSKYPEDYKFLLENCYPYLRRTDYKIDYTIRSYTEAREVKEVMKTRPGNLSLEEFYLAAQDCEPGSEEFNETFITAARMYPNDPTANLNAAVASLQSGSLPTARKYLEKAGDSPLAIYSWGVLHALEGEFGTAEEFFNKASELGVAEASEALEQFENRKKLNTL